MKSWTMPGTARKKETNTVKKMLINILFPRRSTAIKRTEEDAEENADECHEKGIRYGACYEEERFGKDFKIDHAVLLISLWPCFWKSQNAASMAMTMAQ